MEQESLLQAGARPAIRIGGVIVILVSLAAIIVLVGGPMLRALNRWADGAQPPVDWMGFAAILGAVGGFLLTIWSIVKPALDARHNEQMARIRGGQAAVPFSDQPPEGRSGPGGAAGAQP